MKYSSLILVFIVFSLTVNLRAQLIDNNLFLKGKYIEVGIAPNQQHGTTIEAPEGYHPRAAGLYPFYNALGFVADPALDGWEIGTPDYMGDYFLPGVPQEGWDLSIGGTWFRCYAAYADYYSLDMQILPNDGTYTFTGNNTGYWYEGDIVYGRWEGAINDLHITTTTRLDTNLCFFIGEVKLKNIGSSTYPDIYYSRTLDPDNESTLGIGGAITTNVIEYQPDLGSGDLRALVSATGPFYPSLSYLGLGTVDCRAKVYIRQWVSAGGTGLIPGTGPHLVWEHSDYNTDLGFTRVADCAVGLLFNLGDLEPGDSTSFSYIYVLRAEDLDSAFSIFDIGWEVEGLTLNKVDTIEVCRGKEIEVNIIDGESTYEWGEWSPTTGLAYPSGLNNRITVQPETITYQVVGFDKTCRTYDTLRLTIIPIADTTILDEEICEGFYDFNGDTIDVSGSYIQHYSTLEGCDSVVILHLTVKPQAGVEVTAYATDICEGDSALFRVTNPTESTSYQWYRDGFPIEEARALSYMAPSIGGIYFVVGITTTGCTDTSEFILLTVHPAATVVLEETEFGSLCIGDTVALSVDAQPGYLYYWSPEKSFRYTTGGRVPRVKGVMLEEENVIEVTAVTEFGCTARDNMVIYAHPCCYIYIPTAFSPNGDGLNDDFNILLESGQKIVSFQIFDRYGSMVYNNNDIRKGWNGRVENRGEEVAQSVYYYRVLYSCTDGRNYEAKGDVSLFR